MSQRLTKELIATDALLLRRVALRESDEIVHLFTESHGAVSAVARGARRGNKRFSGLEPLHTLRVGIDLSPARELGTLKEAAFARTRLVLAGRLEAMEAAGQALRWLRRAAPARTAEPELWAEISGLLDALDERDAPCQALLAGAGVRMLAAAGWALELSRCVRCGKPVPANARVIVDVHAGGVVCQNCGATGVALGSAERAAMLAAARGESVTANPVPILALVEHALEIHGRGEGT